MVRGLYANDQDPHGSPYEGCLFPTLPRLVQYTPCATARCELLIILARRSRIEDTEGVKSRLGKGQDMTSRTMEPPTAKEKYGRELRGQFLVC